MGKEINTFQIGLYNDDFEDRIKYDAVFKFNTIEPLRRMRHVKAIGIKRAAKRH